MKFKKIKCGPIPLWWPTVLAGICLIGILVGSFLDLQIEQAFANPESFFGQCFESFAEIFGYAMIPISGAMLSKRLIQKENPSWKKALGILLAVVLIGVAAFFAKDTFSGGLGYSFTFNKYLGMAILCVIFLAVYLQAFLLIDDTVRTDKLVINGLAILLSAAFVLILVNFFFKALAYRPRYRAMVYDNTEQGTLAVGLDKYKNWWEFAFFQKPSWFAEANIPSDYIKSWPSGHTADTAIILTLPFYSDVMKKDKRIRIDVLYLLISLYTIIVAIARMRVGAHFLSDVSWGFLISILLVLAVSSLVLKVSSAITKTTYESRSLPIAEVI